MTVNLTITEEDCCISVRRRVAALTPVTVTAKKGTCATLATEYSNARACAELNWDADTPPICSAAETSCGGGNGGGAGGGGAGGSGGGEGGGGVGGEGGGGDGGLYRTKVCECASLAHAQTARTVEEAAAATEAMEAEEETVAQAATVEGDCGETVSTELP